MQLNSVRKIISSPKTKKSIEIFLVVLWGILALSLILVIGLSFFGRPLMSFRIDPKLLQSAAPTSQNPGFAASSRLPRTNWKTVLFGGLVYSTQIYVLENQKPLPNRVCDQY